MKNLPDERRSSWLPKRSEAHEDLPMFADLGQLPAGSQPVETSEAAADALTPERLAKRRLRVLQWFVSRGERGGTADELEEAFGMGHNATSPRVTELIAMGLLKRTTDKRMTRQGSLASVCAITEAGKRWLARRQAA